MKRFCSGLLTLLVLCAVLSAVPAAAETYVESGGQIPDQTQYQGSWQQTFAQILNSHASAIHNMESRTIDCYMNSGYIAAQCRPVGFPDLDGDGTPELVFLEDATGEDYLGFLYIYGSNGNTTRCLLYIPAMTLLSYDDILKFSVYQSASAGSEATLVVEYYEFEWPWLLQFTRNAWGQYTLTSYLHAEFDNSGEDDDRYIRNGQEIPGEAYYTGESSIQNGKYHTVTVSVTSENRTYGFSHTLQSALNQLNQNGANGSFPQSSGKSSTGGSSQNSSQGGSTRGSASDGIYGYTINKLSTRKGPGTQYAEGGTYRVKNQWIKVLAKAWDRRNGIWWVKCEIPYKNKIRVLWTGYKRFDAGTLSLEDLPEEYW